MSAVGGGGWLYLFDFISSVLLYRRTNTQAHAIRRGVGGTTVREQPAVSYDSLLLYLSQLLAPADSKHCGGAALVAKEKHNPNFNKEYLSARFLGVCMCCLQPRARLRFRRDELQQ